MATAYAGAIEAARRILRAKGQLVPVFRTQPVSYDPVSGSGARPAEEPIATLAAVPLPANPADFPPGYLTKRYIDRLICESKEGVSLELGYVFVYNGFRWRAVRGGALAPDGVTIIYDFYVERGA